ncbi:MAG: VWA domain-containing protein [Verrucomicrobia bacterium]|nr:VWA domain-containing protein [Verrucomicrobiota bacterium]
MTAALTAFAALALVALAEWLHARRCRRVARLAFGPSGKPREWTAFVPHARAGAVGALAWGLLTLLFMDSRVRRSNEIPEGGYRHLVIALDVSPSMQLKDGAAGAQKTRMQRAAEVLLSILQRIALDQVRVSVVAFYTGAKPAVVDTFDIEVVKNILNDLPLDMAFDIGKTRLIDGIRESLVLAKPWEEASTTLIVASDGDTVPDTGLPPLPRSINKVLVLGVGDARTGKYIDGHQSRQDASTLRQLATRYNGSYFDVNEKHLPSPQLTALANVMPMKDVAEKGRREWALSLVTAGATLLAGLPVALALAGTSWQAGRQKSLKEAQQEKRVRQWSVVSSQ